MRVKPRSVLSHQWDQVCKANLDKCPEQILKCPFNALKFSSHTQKKSEMGSLILVLYIFQVGVPNPVSGDGGPKRSRNKCRSRQSGSHLQDRAETGVQRWRGRGWEGQESGEMKLQPTSLSPNWLVPPFSTEVDPTLNNQRSQPEGFVLGTDTSTKTMISQTNNTLKLCLGIYKVLE